MKKKQNISSVFIIVVIAISLILTIVARLNEQSLGRSNVHAQTAYTVSGRITGTDGAGIGGVPVQVLNGVGASGMTTTDGNGVFTFVDANVVRPGYYYAVRPSTPAGFVNPPIPLTTTFAFDTGSGRDTVATDMTYENQLAGSNDCAGPDGNGVTGRCNYAFARAGAPAQTKMCVVRAGNPPPIVALPPEDIGATTRKDMDITLQIFLPRGPNGTILSTPPSTNAIPVDIHLTNGSRADDNETVTVNFEYKGADRWEGKYQTLHYPGTRYAFTIWPKSRAKKTICHVGAASPHVLYPNYQCSEDQGTIVLKSGANFIDFSGVIIGLGDLNNDKCRDGHVDSQDLYQLIEYMKQPSRDNTEVADLNMDGAVNQQDYDLAVWSIEHVSE